MEGWKSSAIAARARSLPASTQTACFTYELHTCMEPIKQESPIQQRNKSGE
jgi:hypothetical protein